jgi:ABC-2 type transport system ATP-binding protein
VNPSNVVVSSLHHRFGSRSVLGDVDLSLCGGITTLLGANGAGKSTLLRCLATAIQPSGGSIGIDGLDPSSEAERIEVRRRLGYLPQQIGFSRSATVFDALDYFGVLKGLRDERRRRHLVVDALDGVGLRDRLRDDIGSLSGGMQRRFGLAHALLATPSLIVLDEPSAGLDPDERQRLRSLVADRRSTATIVVSTHLTDEAALGDAVIVLHDGRVVFSGSPQLLAAQAAGRAWIAAGLPPPGVRASWRQADGRHRCLGTPPPGVELVDATVEDGYLLLTGASPVTSSR